MELHVVNVPVGRGLASVGSGTDLTGCLKAICRSAGHGIPPLERRFISRHRHVGEDPFDPLAHPADRLGRAVPGSGDLPDRYAAEA